MWALRIHSLQTLDLCCSFSTLTKLVSHKETPPFVIFFFLFSSLLVFPFNHNTTNSFSLFFFLQWLLIACVSLLERILSSFSIWGVVNFWCCVGIGGLAYSSASGLGSEVIMMCVTSKSIDFAGKNLVSCGCSSNAYFDRYTVRNYAKGTSKGWVSSGHGANKLVLCKRRRTLCRVFSMKTAEPTVNGGTQAIQGLPTGLDLKSYSETPISPSKLFEVVADDLLTLNKNLQSIVGAENPVLMSAAEQIFSAGGKRMRPALVFLVSRATAELLGLKDLTVKHRRLAEIIEMIHTASLIHDDVLDESDLRRGRKTVHQMFGTRVAVLAGDFMFAQSSWYLANLENIEVIKLISQVIKDFASGEIKQASSLFDCGVELDEYLIKSYYKTASLIAASTKGAAIFSGADGSITEKMYEYGRNLGLSFQVVDDILDFTQSAEQLGKPAGTDLAKGNLTAPVIFALEKEPKLRDIIESEFSETGSLDEAIKLVKSCGGVERAQELAKEKADLAIHSLQCLPQSVFRLALEDMVAYNLQRIA